MYRDNIRPEDCLRCKKLEDQIAELKSDYNGKSDYLRPFSAKNKNTCKFCGFVHSTQPLMKLCYGRRGMFGFGWRCPNIPHLHVICLYCDGTWLQETAISHQPDGKIVTERK